MSKPRGNLGFSDCLGDLANFTLIQKVFPRHADVSNAAEAAGFVSRKPKAAEPPKTQRRHRAGRNVPFNIKARPEIIEAFYNVADANGWALGGVGTCCRAARRANMRHLRFPSLRRVPRVQLMRRFLCALPWPQMPRSRTVMRPLA